MMSPQQNRPLRGQGAAAIQNSIDASENTAEQPANQVLIDFALSIERERRALAEELARNFVSNPIAAVGQRLALRDLRLLGQEVGRLAFSSKGEC